MRFEPSQSAEFAAALQGTGRLLSLDLGTKTIGLAVSDADWSVASPVRTIRRTKFTADVTDMLSYAKDNAVAGLVLGLPLNMDESEGPRAQATRAFARNLAAPERTAASVLGRTAVHRRSRCGPVETRTQEPRRYDRRGGGKSYPAVCS